MNIHYEDDFACITLGDGTYVELIKGPDGEATLFLQDVSTNRGPHMRVEGPALTKLRRFLRQASPELETRYQQRQ